MTTITSLTTPGDSSVKFKATHAEPLPTADLEAAVEALDNTGFVKKFAKVDRGIADPAISGQKIGLISFIPAVGAKPNELGVYGFAKLRGNYGNEDESSAAAEKIIREHDSAHTIFHTFVGKPFPMTVSENFADETSEIDIRREEVKAIASAIKNKKKDDSQIAAEMQEREAELHADVCEDKPAAEIEIEDYTTLNVKNAQISWTYIETLKKMKDMRIIIEKARIDIKKANAANPDLSAQFFARFKAAREKAGFKNSDDEYKKGFIRYMLEDVSLPGIDSEDMWADVEQNLVASTPMVSEGM